MFKTGVSQSFALRSFLFLAFINDLPQHITNAHSKIFAGGGVIYKTGKSVNETCRIMQEYVFDARKWFNNYNFSVNLLKTIRMLTSPSSNLNKSVHADDILKLSLQDPPLRQVRDCPHQGI